MDEDAFNYRALGWPTKPTGNVEPVEGTCAFIPVASHITGFDAIMEGLRLAGIECRRAGNQSPADGEQ